ncbi:DUF5763 domain-containing protein [uncultured Kordia sp.]|uniref:DUF5763 domain-containing protein n=1 Tax=uncultured Kordia sp. TaxID=507699 RepID=UPI002611D662|nr:DUF5763 domain-containing protein [uncultured Kordia sp.]
MKIFVAIFLFLFSLQSYSQDVYKTPSGKRYHLSTCRMVENVSSKLVGLKNIERSKLTPCKICKPPPKHKLQKRFTSENKAVGTATSVRCKGYTQKGTRCKHKTKLANGYCYQHTKQNGSVKITPRKSSTTSTRRCLGKTKSGKQCKRKVKKGNYCYQHN